uniref:1-phosphatidylinositol-3-phosphate 5-kinase n=1 Tax=Meloidogyne hapla TaxID=6305 RepID=A0A1I8B394_MELHA
MSSPTKSNSNSIFYFPAFIDTTNNQENNYEQNGGFLGILSNLFRPSKSSSTTETVFSEEINISKSEEKDVVFEDSVEETFNNCSEQQQPSTSKPTSFFNSRKNELRRYWMPDSSGNECYECREKFNTFRRKHHCRLCGQIFCKNCTSHQLNGVDFGCYGVVRLCNFCANQIDTKNGLSGGTRGKLKLFPPSIHHSVDGSSDRIFTLHQSKLKTSPNGFLHPSTSIDFVEENERHLNSNNKQLNSELPCSPSNSLKNVDTQTERQLIEMFDNKLNKLLDTLLIREQLGNSNWKDLLWKLSKLATDKIYPVALNNASTNFPLDFLIIDGIAFTKSLAHSSMPTSMEKISLILLSGMISYERVLEKFSSIESLMQQEEKFLHLQCDRILSVDVNMLITENAIPVAVLDLLTKKGISVLANVKRSVLNRISRATSTSILNSIDAQLLQPRVGIVSKFRQLEFDTSTNNRKHFVLLEDSEGGEGNKFGITILLKSKDLFELKAAKRILRFLILSRYSSKLEISFLSLFNSLPKEMSNEQEAASSFHCHICELNQKTTLINEKNLNEKESSEKENFLNYFSQIELTNSPAMHFPPPTLLNQWNTTNIQINNKQLMPDYFIKLKEMQKEYNQIIENLRIEEKNLKEENFTKFSHPFLQSNTTQKPWELLSQRAVKSFRLGSALHFRRRAEKNFKAKEERLSKTSSLLFEMEEEEIRVRSETNLLSPYSHQGLAFLFCANSKKSKNTQEFCMGPYVLNKIFYDRENDTSLGKFLLNYCFDSDYRCKCCDRPMFEHLRRIVHRNTRLEITTRNVSISRSTAAALIAPVIPNPFGSGAILCIGTNEGELSENCSANSSIVPMPNTIFHLSFAKFVDYLANGKHWISPFSSSVDLHQCLHCTFHSHSHFFAFGNLVSCFRTSPVYPLNVYFSQLIFSLEINKEFEQNICPKIRDVLDGKGTPMPDIGAIIATSLLSDEYLKINECASFFRTDDERFVLKTLSRFELDSFKNCSQKYIDYMNLVKQENRPTALCKDIKQIWDLKGSLRNRLASTKSSSNLNPDGSTISPSAVLLDENYLQDIWRNQIYLLPHSKTLLSQAIINDSNFLANQGIMDYSLLAGISRGQEDEVIVGIVDYMPTVISPEQYRKRFYERIDGYFAIAPDQWTSG